MAPRNPYHAPDDPDTLSLLRSMIMKGLVPSAAAEAIGLPKQTFYDWMGAHPAFAASVKEATAELKAKLATVVSQQAFKSKNWVAAMTLLERLWPEEYGRRDRVRHEHSGVVGMAVVPAKLSSEAMLKLADVEADLASDDLLQLPEHQD